MKSIELRIESKLNHLKLLCKSCKAACATVVKDEILLYNMELCLDELVANVIKHAYSGKSGNYINVFLEIYENEIDFKVIDEGENSFSNNSYSDMVYNTKDIQSLPESGRGLFIIHKFMDVVEFERDKKSNKNITTMKKYINV